MLSPSTPPKPNIRVKNWLNKKMRRDIVERLIFYHNRMIDQQPKIELPTFEHKLVEAGLHYLLQWQLCGKLDDYQTLALFNASAVGLADVVKDVVKIGNANPSLRIPASAVLSLFNNPQDISLTYEMGNSAPALLKNIYPNLKGALGEMLDIMPEWESINYTLNPILDGTYDVKLPTPVAIADGWLIVCKVAPQIISPDLITEMSLYALLDWFDRFRLRGVIVYFGDCAYFMRLGFAQLFGDEDNVIRLRWELQANLRRDIWDIFG